MTVNGKGDWANTHFWFGQSGCPYLTRNLDRPNYDPSYRSPDTPSPQLAAREAEAGQGLVSYAGRCGSTEASASRGKLITRKAQRLSNVPHCPPQTPRLTERSQYERVVSARRPGPSDLGGCHGQVACRWIAQSPNLHHSTSHDSPTRFLEVRFRGRVLDAKRCETTTTAHNQSASKTPITTGLPLARKKPGVQIPSPPPNKGPLGGTLCGFGGEGDRAGDTDWTQGRFVSRNLLIGRHASGAAAKGTAKRRHQIRTVR
jgi:hypothetical protein